MSFVDLEQVKHFPDFHASFQQFEHWPFQATADTKKTIPIPPLVGGAALVGGIVLVVVGARKS